DEVGIELLGRGPPPDTEQPVLGVDEDPPALQVVGDQGRDADPKVDDVTVAELQRGPPRDEPPSVVGGAHAATTTSTYRCGVTIASGSSSPTSTTSSTSARTRSAAVAIMGLK